MKVSGLIAVVLSLAAVPSIAGVVIESVNKHQIHSRVSIEPTRAKIDTGSTEGYLLMDLASGKSYSVNHLEGVAIDHSSPVATSEHITNAVKDRMMPKVALVRLGKGPEVSGYPTVHYRVMINEKIHCSDEYLSPQLLDNVEIKNFVSAMAKGSDGSEAIIMASLFGDQHMCEAAADVIDDQYPERGVPLRSLDPTGRVIHEITRVSTDVTFPQGELTIPDGYRLLSRDEMREIIKERNKEIQVQIDALPEIDMEAVIARQREMQQRMRDASKEIKGGLKTGFE